MVLHNVYFWIKEEVGEDGRQAFEAGMKTYLTAVETVHQYAIGTPAGTPQREVVDHSFDYAIFVWFKTVEDHNAYQTHPAHDVFVDSFSKIWEKVQVLDTELS